MDGKVYCKECNKYFENIESFDKEHNKISFQIMKVKHNYLIGNNCLAYIAKLFDNDIKIIETINNQNVQIQQLKSKLNYYEDAFKNDVLFECNINMKNISNKISGICLIHFFPKCIHFRIECSGDIIFEKRKEFEIEILFPFKKSEIKTSSIEKLQGCISNQKILNVSEQETIVFNNYNSIVVQRDYITSVKLVRNYNSVGYLEQKKINVILNGLLTFSSFKYDLSLPFILYNITQKKFLFYENYQWKFGDNCFLGNGKINNNYIINIETNQEMNEIYIKNQYKYLQNKPNFVTSDKAEGKYKLYFINKFYGIITIGIDELYLSCSNTDNESITLSKEKNYFIIYNV